MDVDRMLIDLGVIGQLKGSDKLGVIRLPGEQQLVVDSGSSWFQGLSRWYYRCDRTAVLVYLWGLVFGCEKQCDLICDQSTDRLQALRCSLVSAIDLAATGLQNLKTTYSNDSNTVSQLTLIVRKLESVKARLAGHEDAGT
jgi:hypothetical protein